MRFSFGSLCCGSVVLCKRGTCNLLTAPGSDLPYTGSPEEMGFVLVGSGPDDISMRQCRVEAKSFGKAAGRVVCQNSSGVRHRVAVPQGYMFEPQQPDMQTLIAEQAFVFWIDPGKTTTKEFDAFCGYSKGRIPSGAMRPTGLRAPPEVLTGQPALWTWTRPWERPRPENSKSLTGGLFRALWPGASSKAAADEAKVLQQSYGIDAKQHKALQDKLAHIDQDPQMHPRKAGRGARVDPQTPPSPAKDPVPAGPAQPPSRTAQQDWHSPSSSSSSSKRK